MSRLFLQSNLLQELKTKLAEYFNMPLEDLLKANAFDDVEKTVNSLVGLTTDVIQKNILENLSNRLKYFKEYVPKTMSNAQSSSEFISNYESLNVELNTKMSEGKEILRELECKLSETCEEEYAIEMEIQQLITRKMEILTQRNSLASQRDHSTEAICNDYAEWKALGEDLRLSTEKWLRSKEDLAHANASWKLFKESLGF